jgi:hypothetical protein
LAQRIEPVRKMKWSDMDISLGPKDHPKTELSIRNLSFMVKLSIGQHKVTKTSINNGASLNLIMGKTFIEMGPNLKDLTPVHDTFHGVIPRQSSTPIGRINLEVSCGIGDNKCKEMLMFEVASFDIGYNCIIRRPFLLKFMVVIHTAYVTMKMPGLKGVITIKADCKGRWPKGGDELRFLFVLKTLMRNLNKVNLHNSRSPNSPNAR